MVKLKRLNAQQHVPQNGNSLQLDRFYFQAYSGLCPSHGVFWQTSMAYLLAAIATLCSQDKILLRELGLYKLKRSSIVVSTTTSNTGG